MGLDCKLLTESGRYDLSRFSYFKSEFNSSDDRPVIYKKKEFLNKITSLKNTEDYKKYGNFWIDEAEREVGGFNMIITDNFESNHRHYKKLPKFWQNKR
jgi:hypothetical protein